MPTPAEIRVDAIYRYPVKGLTPEPLDAVELETSAYFPHDRLYAIENGPSGFNAVAPRHLPKAKFLMLMRNEGLARLRSRYNEATRVLTIETGEDEPLTADLGTEEGRRAVEDLMRRLIPDALRGEPQLLEAPPAFRFTDTPAGYVSLINLASVRAVEEFVGAPVDPLRFRANLYVEGFAPFEELELSGRVIEAPGGLRLKLTERTPRCAATNVDPVSGVRDLDIPRSLDARLGHRDCGIYAEVIAGGRIGVGDRLSFAA